MTHETHRCSRPAAYLDLPPVGADFAAPSSCSGRDGDQEVELLVLVGEHDAARLDALEDASCPVVDARPASRSPIAEWVRGLVGDGLVPGEVGVFVRSETEVDRAVRAVGAAGIPCAVLDETTHRDRPASRPDTMHLAKGLEFRAPWS